MSRFAQAWADVAKENGLLKVLVMALAGTSIVLGFTSMQLGLREPLIIERGCVNQVIGVVNSAHTALEYESFLKSAIPQRFDTAAAINGDLLSLEELKARENEQGELKRREMTQRVLVNRVTGSGESYTVDADRVIAVGSIRSAFSFPLQVKVQTTSRSISNPYGLVLTFSQSVSDNAPGGKTNAK